MSNIPVRRSDPRVPRSRIPEPETPPARGLSSTIILSLGTFAVGTDTFVVAGFLPQMAKTLQVSPQAAGQSVTVFAVAYAVLAGFPVPGWRHIARADSARDCPLAR